MSISATIMMKNMPVFLQALQEIFTWLFAGELVALMVFISALAELGAHAEHCNSTRSNQNLVARPWTRLC